MKKEINIEKEETLSDKKYILKNYTFNRQKKDGTLLHKKAEVYNPGNAATILLYNKEKGTIILTRQFRLPSYLNGNPTGMLLETCAGKIEKESPEEAIRREAEEEAGYRIKEVKKIFQLYMTPGSVTELLHFYTASYDESSHVSAGGGLEDEQEDIEVVELEFQQALDMLDRGEIQDAKTVILLQYARLQGYFALSHP
ncbi:MAG: NUDIX domain-containing protein [Williamsia sp.]|nr:NUDIX domain-containing protein [Williamsia sp.]